MTATLLMAILGLVACALDIGWIAMTRTQLQSAADASALAAGTELLPGFGYKKTKTPAQIETAAKPVAVEYAGYNRNAELNSTLVDENRDIEFGKATYDDDCSCWVKTPNSSDYYNYVEVSALRNQAGSTAGDGRAPLFFARILGMADTALQATSTVAQLQANGFRVPPDSDDTVDMIPFAVAKRTWGKMERAQAYYNTHPTVFANTTNPFASNYYGRIPDAVTGEPLFGRRSGSIFGFPIVRQEFFDDFTRTDAGVVTGATSSGGRRPDGKLELNIIDWEEAIGDAWNFGTIHVGASSHAWGYINGQIRNGISENDMSYYDNNQFVASESEPMTFDAHVDLLDIFFNLNGSAFTSIRGKCKAIALYSSVSGSFNPEYTVDRFVAATVVRHQVLLFITTEIRMQPCKLVENNALPDTERPIDDNSTIFTPLTLIR